MSRNKLSRKPAGSADKNSHQILHQEFSGPLPPPAALENYEKILPGAAERIIILAEGEASHRRDIEKMTRKAEIRLAKGEHYQIYFGQFCAFIVTLAFVAGAVFLLHNDKQVSGTLLASGAAAIIVLAFLKRKSSD